MIPLSSFERGPKLSNKLQEKSRTTSDKLVEGNHNTLEIAPKKEKMVICGRNARILSTNVFLSAVHTALAVVTLVSTKNMSLAVPVFAFQISVNYTTDHDENINSIQEKNLSSIEEVFAPELVALNPGLPIAWLTFSFFAITAFFHFGAGILWYQYYLKSLNNYFNWLRWFEYSITAPLMWLVIAQSFAFIEVTQL